jgi:hypothetical protein
MKKIILLSMSLLILSVLNSCSSIKVIADYDPLVNFENYRSYAFYKKGIDQVQISDLDKKRILKAIETSLQSKGFRPSEQPDILVNIFTKEESKIDIYNNNGMGWGWGWNPWFWPGMGMQTTQISTRAEGRLFIDLIETKNKRLIWQGSGVGLLEPSSDPIKKQEIIQKFVNEILSQYPPKKQ